MASYVDFSIGFTGADDQYISSVSTPVDDPIAQLAVDGSAHTVAGRVLIRYCTGSSSTSDSGDCAWMADDVIKFINKVLAKHSAKAGAVCLMGYSSGCFLALAVAAKLKTAGFGRLAYIGLGDLPIFPYGRTPPVGNGIGQVRPSNDPSLIAAGGGIPQVAGFPVDADVLDNYYQTSGNGAPKPVWNKPNGKAGWWWDSSMTYGEVHGTVDGWTNIALAAPTVAPKLPGAGAITSASNYHTNFCRQVCPAQFKKDATAAMLAYIKAHP